MSNKAKATGISTSKPAAPAPAPAPADKKQHIPTPGKINAGNVEYAPEKIEEVLANFTKLAEEAEEKIKASRDTKPERPIARNIVAKLFPQIKILLDKNFSKKEIYTMFTEQGIAINQAGFNSAVKKQLKSLEAAAAAAALELETSNVVEVVEVVEVASTPATPEELENAEKEALNS